MDIFRKKWLTKKNNCLVSPQIGQIYNGQPDLKLGKDL